MNRRSRQLLERRALQKRAAADAELAFLTGKRPDPSVLYHNAVVDGIVDTRLNFRTYQAIVLQRTRQLREGR